jgi:hypothetical protein
VTLDTVSDIITPVKCRYDTILETVSEIMKLCQWYSVDMMQLLRPVDATLQTGSEAVKLLRQVQKLCNANLENGSDMLQLFRLIQT